MTETLDGMPLPSEFPVAFVPNEHFKVMASDLKEDSQECILDVGLRTAWACLLPMELGITVTGQGWDANLTVDQYPLNRKLFTYGAQRPDLPPQPIQLVPSTDQDDKDLGPSLFAHTEYDKLTIGTMSFCISDTIPY